MKKRARGNNKVSKFLNMDISNGLGKKKKSSIGIIWKIVFYLVILLIFTYHLGFETGVIFTVGMWLASLIGGHQQEQREKILKKHPMKAFDDTEK